MSKIKLLVCDLDGTLLNEKKEITKFTMDTLLKVKEQGIKICFASGRNDQMMSIYEDAIKGCDYLLSCNGAKVCDAQKEVLFHAYLPSIQVANIQKFLCERGMVSMLYTTDSMYYVDGCDKLYQRIKAYEKLSKEQGFYKKLDSMPMNMKDDFSQFHTVTKIVAYEQKQDKIDQLKAFVAKESSITCEATGYGMMGIFSNHVSKQQGIETIKKKMAITNEQVAVFGDFDNDISMFACGEMSVAMANASDSLKACARYQCASNEEDGVANFILENIL